MTRVTIGLPVYNGEATLPAALDTLLAQDFRDFDLIIADNASTDKTAEIATAFAAQDPRVRVVRHSENCGALSNFAYVLEHATAPLFMWAAADDQWSPDFLSRTVAALDANPNHVSAITPVHFEGRAADPKSMGDGLLTADDLGARVVAFFDCWHANSVLYSLFRRDVLTAALHPIGRYLGFDWTMMLRATRQGPSLRLDDGWLARGLRGESSDPSILTRARSRPVHWLLPFHDVSGEAMRAVAGEPRHVRLTVLRRLIWLNQTAARAQFRQARLER